MQTFVLGAGGCGIKLVLRQAFQAVDISHIEHVGVALIQIVVGKLDTELSQTVLDLNETGLCLVIQKGTALDKTAVVFLQHLYLLCGESAVVFLVV